VWSCSSRGVSGLGGKGLGVESSCDWVVAGGEGGVGLCLFAVLKPNK
jgi:hypothetical protein